MTRRDRLLWLHGFLAMAPSSTARSSTIRKTLSRRRLGVGGRLLVLDSWTLGALGAWLEERRRRYPLTANPHLFVNHCSAASRAPISRQVIYRLFLRLGTRASEQRVSRLLTESADEPGHGTGPGRLRASVMGGAW